MKLLRCGTIAGMLAILSFPAFATTPGPVSGTVTVPCVWDGTSTPVGNQYKCNPNAPGSPLFANIVNFPTTFGLDAGSQIIGKVGIDQTTPGVSNKVSLGFDVVSVAPPNPGSGADHSGSAPTALTILASCTVTNPGEYRVQNQSAETLQVIMDNGSTGPTIILLPSGGLGQSGGSTAPELPWFTGRIQVAGRTGSQFAARCN